VFKKTGIHFIFAITLRIVDRSLKIFGNVAAKKICNKTHISNVILMRGITACTVVQAVV